MDGFQGQDSHSYGYLLYSFKATPWQQGTEIIDFQRSEESLM